MVCTRWLIFLILIFSINLSCGKLDLELPKSGIDFLKTEIIVGGSNIANGTAEMIIVVHLKNSDGSAVYDYKPTYQVTSSLGITAGECTKSSREGVSVCILKSTRAGSKVLKLTNALTGLEKAIEFQGASGGQIFAAISGAKKHMSTPAGYKVNLSAGESPKWKKAVTAGGYELSLSVGATLDSM